MSWVVCRLLRDQRVPAAITVQMPDDAPLTMPPWLLWYVGRDDIGSFFRLAWKTCSGIRMMPASANGQPVFASYTRNGADAPWVAHTIQALAFERDAISALTLFFEASSPGLFKAFGFPLTLPDVEGCEPCSTPH